MVKSASICPLENRERAFIATPVNVEGPLNREPETPQGLLQVTYDVLKHSVLFNDGKQAPFCIALAVLRQIKPNRLIFKQIC